MWLHKVDEREEIQHKVSKADRLYQIALDKKPSLLVQINQEFNWFAKLIMRRSSARKELEDSLFANKQRLLIDALYGDRNNLKIF